MINHAFDKSLSAGGDLFLKTMSEKGVERIVKGVERVTKGTVLLVDDEEVIIEVGKDLLEALGYRVIIARDGIEAIEVYRNDQKGIGFVILDMVMPIMGGGEAYDRMKEGDQPGHQGLALKWL